MVNVPWCHDCNEPLGLCLCCEKCGHPPEGYKTMYKLGPKCKANCKPKYKKQPDKTFKYPKGVIGGY